MKHKLSNQQDCLLFDHISRSTSDDFHSRSNSISGVRSESMTSLTRHICSNKHNKNELTADFVHAFIISRTVSSATDVISRTVLQITIESILSSKLIISQRRSVRIDCSPVRHSCNKHNKSSLRPRRGANLSLQLARLPLYPKVLRGRAAHHHAQHAPS